VKIACWGRGGGGIEDISWEIGLSRRGSAGRAWFCGMGCKRRFELSVRRRIRAFVGWGGEGKP